MVSSLSPTLNVVFKRNKSASEVVFVVVWFLSTLLLLMMMKDPRLWSSHHCSYLPLPPPKVPFVIQSSIGYNRERISIGPRFNTQFQDFLPVPTSIVALTLCRPTVYIYTSILFVPPQCCHASTNTRIHTTNYNLQSSRWYFFFLNIYHLIFLFLSRRDPRWLFFLTRFRRIRRALSAFNEAMPWAVNARHSKKEREAPTSLRLWLSNTHTQKKGIKRKKNDRVFIGLYTTIDSANNSECKRKASMTKVYFSFFF